MHAGPTVQEFGISRATVGRLLRRAQEEGIVEIRVRPHSLVSADLERQLTERFHIKRALIAVDHKDADRQRELLAGLVASELERILVDGSIVAVGMGRNVSSVSEHALSATRRECHFVSAIGGSYRGGEAMNADHIARRLAARFGGKSESLYAPALVGDPQLRKALLDNDTVRHTLDKARRADIAPHRRGRCQRGQQHGPHGLVFRAGDLGRPPRGGRHDGLRLHRHPRPAGRNPMQDRVIGLSREDLLRIPNVIAVAAESSKVTAILGALRTGAIDTLATTTANAAAVLQLDDVMGTTR